MCGELRCRAMFSVLCGTDRLAAGMTSGRQRMNPRGRARRFPPSARRSWRASGRGAASVDHQVRAGAGVRSVIRIREPGIDREILAGIRVHQAGSDGVEALRRLAVARLDLRTQLARPAADLLSAKECEAPAVVLLPNLEFGFLLEDAHQDRTFLLHLLGFELGQHTFRQRLHVATDGDRPAAAAGKVITAAIAAGTSSALRRSRERRVGWRRTPSPYPEDDGNECPDF